MTDESLLPAIVGCPSTPSEESASQGPAHSYWGGVLEYNRF